MTEDSNGHKQSSKKMAVTYSAIYLRRLVLTTIAIFLLLAGVAALLVWLVYHPTAPSFVIVGASIFYVNTTSSTMISTTMQFTVAANNPNRRVSIYFDHLTAYVTYKNEAITPPLPLPPLFQGHRSTVAMALMLGGTLVPVSQEVRAGLVRDRAYGVIGLRLVLLGRLRWKAGAIKSGRYGLYVRCDVLVGMKKGHTGPVPLLGNPDCSVEI